MGSLSLVPGPPAVSGPPGWYDPPCSGLSGKENCQLGDRPKPQDNGLMSESCPSPTSPEPPSLTLKPVHVEFTLCDVMMPSPSALLPFFFFFFFLVDGAVGGTL